jgi:PAS domain S-box-containing protein
VTALETVNRILGMALSDFTEEAMCEACLHLLEAATDSSMSFIGEVETDGLLHALAISNPGWAACSAHDASGHRKPPGNFIIHGIYGRVLLDGKSLIVNDPSSHPDRVGLPDGHPALTAFLGVPLLRQGRTVGMIAVGNRRGGYRLEDQQVLEEIAPAVVEALDRKRAESALRASEERFRGLVEQSVDGIFVANAKGEYEDVNEAGAAMLGYSADEVRRLTLLDVLDPAELDRMPDQLAQLATGAVVTSEWRFRRKDGSTFTGEVVGRQFPDGHLQGVLRDVTERRQVEAALRESEDQFRVLADNLVSAVALINERGEFSIVNRSFLRMFGLDEATDILNVNSMDWSRWQVFDESGALLPLDEHPVRRAALTLTAVRDVLVALRLPAHAELKWLLVSAEPILDDQGRLHRLICTYHDITARKRAEEALREAVAALNEADRRKDEFIAILSHELRNPLAPIRYALPALGVQDLDEVGARALAVVGRQVDHLVRLVDDLLDVSRITRGKVELRRDYVTVASVLAAAAEASSPALTAGGHALRMELPDEAVWIHADRARIAQVVTNLLDNSAKFTPSPGEIVLRAERDGDAVVVRVRDSGVGIPAEALPTVFEMFRQVRPGSSQGGLGIGLALVERLVQMHGGTVEAYSEGIDRGAEFVIRLPAADSAEVSKQTEAATGENGRRLRVLVVDDNADLVEMLSIVVESAGHEVRKAMDGASAVSAALDFRPDVVLLDIGLPGMSGIDVARELRRRPETSAVWLIALTGWGQEEDRRQTRDSGFDHHLTKPAEPAGLERLLEAIALEAPRSARPEPAS